jgi:hypothetical protein
VTGDVVRPAFAAELLARLERERLRPRRSPGALPKAVAGAALTACVALVVAARGRRR